MPYFCLLTGEADWSQYAGLLLSDALLGCDGLGDCLLSEDFTGDLDLDLELALEDELWVFKVFSLEIDGTSDDWCLMLFCKQYEKFWFSSFNFSVSAH